jgi:hypothetical protein
MQLMDSARRNSEMLIAHYAAKEDRSKLEQRQRNQIRFQVAGLLDDEVRSMSCRRKRTNIVAFGLARLVHPVLRFISAPTNIASIPSTAVNSK